MKILFVATNLPVPTNNGLAIRSFSIIRELASMGHDVTFISFARSGKHPSLRPLSECCSRIELIELELTNISRCSDIGRRIRCLLSFKSYSIERFRSSEMKSRITCLLARTQFSLIVCDSIYALANIPISKIPVLLNCHNVEHVIFERYSQVEKDVFRKLYAFAEARLVRRAERRSADIAVGAMVCSEVDRQLLCKILGNVPLVVVPNTIDTDLYCPHENIGMPPVIVFQGGMDWYPNRDAVEFFIKRILSRIRSEFPTVKFLVVGRNPPAEFVSKFTKELFVEFTGTVVDTRPYLSSATIAVVPLRLGSGTRIKILEACAAGVPVVSTRIGAEGLDLEKDKEIILADGPDEFADAVRILLRDHAQRNAIASRAREAIVSRYGNAILQKRLEGALSELSSYVNKN
jgi:glycosyltransferase involved in cell wall biosynthesis